MSSELRTNSGFVFANEDVEKMRAATRGMLATLEVQRKILGQALHGVSHDCPECGQPMDRYGLHWRCQCGFAEEA